VLRPRLRELSIVRNRGLLDRDVDGCRAIGRLQFVFTRRLRVLRLRGTTREGSERNSERNGKKALGHGGSPANKEGYYVVIFHTRNYSKAFCCFSFIKSINYIQQKPRALGHLSDSQSAKIVPEPPISVGMSFCFGRP